MKQDANDIHREFGDEGLRSAFDQAAHKANGHGKTYKSAAELQHKVFPPIRFIVPGYIAEGCTLLAGRPKLGKSWMMLEIGLAVAIGDGCLGGIMCESGDVLYLALEDNQRRLQSRITKLLGVFAKDWPARFHYETEWPRANSGGLQEIREWIASVKQPRLIVVDVLAKFRDRNRDRNAQQYDIDYDIIQALQAIASETGIAIVIVHHVRKSGADDDPFEKISGTFGLSGGADTAMVLDRDSNGCTLYGRGRDIEEIESAIEFDRNTCRWRVLGAASEVRVTDERKRILSVLIDAGEPMSPNKIAAATGMPRNNVDQLLFKMAGKDEILKTGRGLYASHTPHKNDKKVRKGESESQQEQDSLSSYRPYWGDKEEGISETSDGMDLTPYYVADDDELNEMTNAQLRAVIDGAKRQRWSKSDIRGLTNYLRSRHWTFNHDDLALEAYGHGWDAPRQS